MRPWLYRLHSEVFTSVLCLKEDEDDDEAQPILVLPIAAAEEEDHDDADEEDDGHAQHEGQDEHAPAAANR